jgi:hypothetical protein
MPLKKDIQDPDADKPKADKKKPSASAPETEKDPWKYLDDGTKVRQGRKLPFENQLRDLFDTVSGAVKLADSFSGEVIGNQSEELAYGYAKLAKEDPRIKLFFEKLVTGSAYSAVIVPTALTAIPIMWHFGLLPAKVGVPVTIASGMIPFTREQEREYLAAQEAEQAETAAAERRNAEPTHPHGEPPPETPQP